MKKKLSTNEDTLKTILENYNEPMDINQNSVQQSISNLSGLCQTQFKGSSNMFSNLSGQGQTTFSNSASRDPACSNFLSNSPTNKAFRKYQNQCDLCDFSTPNSAGVSIHRTKVHGCKYIDEYGKTCKNVNCQLHKLIFDSRNRSGLKEKNPINVNYVISQLTKKEVWAFIWE